jgi:hypothetical protein
MSKLPAAATWAKHCVLPVAEVRWAESVIRRQLKPEELAVLDRLPTEATVQLLCGAASPWDGIASVLFVRRRLASLAAAAAELEKRGKYE